MTRSTRCSLVLWGIMGLLVVATAAVSRAEPSLVLDMVPIGNPGNTGTAGNGFGPVAYSFEMARTETTNAEYVAFLNNSVAGQQDRYGVFNTTAADNPSSTYAIRRTGSPGNFVYSVVTPDANNKPVNWVSWFSAARLANWLTNGANLAADTENGSYTLVSGAVSGAIPARNPGAVYVLPSIDEWTKAAFYVASSGTYLQYPTVSSVNAALNGTLPAAGNPTTPANTFAANYGGGTNAGITPVGYFSTVTSPYGLFDMLGNVNEMTDTTVVGDSTRYYQVSGSYQTAVGSISGFGSQAAPASGVGSITNAPRGFRIAAVPEPSAIVILGGGVGVGIIGSMVRRRRGERQTA